MTKLLLECDLLQKIIKLLQNDKATPEVLFNSISLLEALQKTGTISNNYSLYIRAQNNGMSQLGHFLTNLSK